MSLIGRYDIRMETFGSRRYSWAIWRDRHLVAREIDPETCASKVYPRLRDAQLAASLRCEELVAVDDRILDLVGTIWGFGSELTSLIEVLQAMVDDDAELREAGSC